MGRLGYWLLLLSNGHNDRSACYLNTNFQDLSAKSEILIPSPHKVSISKNEFWLLIQGSRLNTSVYPSFSQNTIVMTTKKNKRE